MVAAATLGHPPIEVNAADFRAAAGRLPRMKRGPVGANGRIPSDTVLSPDTNGVMVETPVMASLVQSTTPWRIKISVEARRLVDVCENFKKIGAYKAPTDTFILSVQDNELRIRYRTTTVAIPIF